MHSTIVLIVSFTQLIIASSSVFSVHDDLLAYPQYEVIFSENPISDTQASIVISEASPTLAKPSVASAVISLTPSQDDRSERPLSASPETYELLRLHDKSYLCNIPIIEPPAYNETLEREARATERQELARATDRGWELLQELEGNCLYFVSGWWSYSFCHNNQVVQFHQLNQQPGAEEPAKHDPSSMQFVLGRAPNKDENWKQSNSKSTGQIDMPTNTKAFQSELQVKGGIRYLVQRMDGGTICDLTGKPRKIEIQFHCHPTVTDRIGYIKEITTCSYLMVVYTPRLCNDAAFLPPKENIVHAISCRMVIPEEDFVDQVDLPTIEIDSEVPSSQVTKKKEAPKAVGGIILGGGKWINIENQQMPIPEIFGEEIFQHQDKVVEVVARSKSKAQGGQVEVITPADLKKLDLDPELIEALRAEVQNMAKEKGWKIEIVDSPGQARELLGIVDEDEDTIKDNKNNQESEESEEENEKLDAKDEL